MTGRAFPTTAGALNLVDSAEGGSLSLVDEAVGGLELAKEELVTPPIDLTVPDDVKGNSNDYKDSRIVGTTDKSGEDLL